MFQRLGPPGARPVKPGGASQSGKPFRQFLALLVGDRRGEADVVKQALRVIETEQQRADFRSAAQISKAADCAIGGAQALDLDHCALAALIASVEPLGDDSVPSVAVEIIEPPCRLGEIARAGRDDELSRNRGLLAKGLERAPPLGERQRSDRRATGSDQHVEQDEPRWRFL